MPLQCTICRAPQARLWVVTTVRSTALKGHLVSRLMTPVFILISAICKKIGAWETAIAQYKSTLKINPNYAEIYSNMGQFIAGIGQLSAAIDSFKHALKIKSNYAEAYANFSLPHLLNTSLETISVMNLTCLQNSTR